MTTPATTEIALEHPPETAPLNYAEVVLNLPLRESFTYEIPSRFLAMIKPGMRVFVPFGRRKLTGYVVSLSGQKIPGLSLKAIEDILDTAPVLSDEILQLTRWISDYYQSSWGEAIKAALPAGLEDESRDFLTLTEKGMACLADNDLGQSSSLILKTVLARGKLTTKQLQRLLNEKFSAGALAQMKENRLLQCHTLIRRSSVNYEYEKMVRIAPPLLAEKESNERLKRSPRQKAIYELLRNGEKRMTEILEIYPNCSSALKNLREKELIEIITAKRHRTPRQEESTFESSCEEPLKLTRDQKDIYTKISRSIDAPEFKVFLLHGITGSGKTEIYLRCIQRALDQGKTAIMMVPEISLTPQTVVRFQKRFGNQVAILHSGMTQRERYQEWKKIHDGEVSIVVGARSSVFAPFKNPGIIVIDEEHDPSYKQDSTPRYHARDTAIVRAKNQNAVVVLGSATPSMESMMNAESGKYDYMSLNQRVQNRLLPLVRMVDMNKEKDERKNFSILSRELKSAIRNRLGQKEQVFLFLNRRGTANYVFCKECGFVYHCVRCSVTLTFHGRENSLRCHYCNFTVNIPRDCADCKGEVIRFSGFGTQKLEDETRRLFPDARITRLDRDTARDKKVFESMHQQMRNGEIDILIGTQMITKGHDFPNVTLVGVVHADLSLNIPDFRSCERSFQLLTQVAGRAGRGNVPGQVIIQTHSPWHHVFDFVREHDFSRFYEKERAFRKSLHYPPFTRMIALEIECENETLGGSLTGKVKTVLSRMLRQIPGLEMLGPSPAALYRIKDKFRWHIILRSPSARSLGTFLRGFAEKKEIKTLFTRKARLTIDVDPVNLL